MEFDESSEDDQEREDEVEETDEDEDIGEGEDTIEDDSPEDGDGTIEEGDDPEEAPEEAEEVPDETAELPTEEAPEETAELPPEEVPEGPKEAELPTEAIGPKEETELPPEEVPEGPKEAELPPEVTTGLKESVDKAVDEIMKDQGKNISPSNKELADNAKVELMPRTGSRLGVTSRPGNGTATVRIAASTPAKMDMTARHEANHLLSNLHHVLIPKSSTSYEVHHTSGFRHVAEVHTLKGVTTKETGRGLNEAVTQRLTERSSGRNDGEVGKAGGHGYREASALVGALETLIGPEVIAQNYYAGGTGVKDAFNELAGGRASYEQFLEACDRAIGHNVQERQAGVQDALEILAILEEAKDSR